MKKSRIFNRNIKRVIIYRTECSFIISWFRNNEEKLKNIVQGKGLNNYVKFLGVRKDVSELMNAADILLLPSKNEGLGMVAIEAQSCGLKVLASDNVPRATNLTELIEYLPLDSSINI